MNIRIFSAFSVVIGLIILTACYSPKSDRSPDGPAETLTLGVGDPKQLSSLIWIAKDQGYFSQHGLKIDIKSYESGLAAAKDLVARKVDLATASEIVAAGQVLEGINVRIITSLCESDDVKLVARRDRCITQIADVRHKRIGVLRGSGGEFYLDLLMALQNIPSQEIRKVDMQPSELAQALSKGEIDAAVIWEPFVTPVTEELGANALSWSAQSGQDYDWLLLGMEEIVKTRPRAIRSLVSSLLSAEEFVKNRRDEAKTIVARKSGLSNLDALWKATTFRVGLDRHLVLKMEAQMRWMDSRIATRQLDMPDLFNFIYFDALSSIRPDRIGMLH